MQRYQGGGSTYQQIDDKSDLEFTACASCFLSSLSISRKRKHDGASSPVPVISGANLRAGRRARVACTAPPRHYDLVPRRGCLLCSPLIPIATSTPRWECLPSLRRSACRVLYHPICAQSVTQKYTSEEVTNSHLLYNILYTVLNQRICTRFVAGVSMVRLFFISLSPEMIESHRMQCVAELQ